MDHVHDDCYMVFVRTDPDHSRRPDAAERPLVRCSTYEEARWVRQENQGPGRKCIIRYIGTTGGGD